MKQTPRAITWEAPEHYYQEKGGDWYFSLAIITIAVVVAALMFGNVLFALLLLLSGFALAIIGAKKPSVVPFAVTVRGVRVGDELYPLSTLKSYHIDEEDPRGPQLIILTKKHFLPLLVMPIPTDYIDDIDDILQGKIKEELLNEPLFMRALERFGF
ncbi:MAG: hypothetical protein KBC78_02875 [Candidatus Pacebacteria bacterium]|nr:hypothetical protein [Candidatus Paceibacterota bacterium]